MLPEGESKFLVVFFFPFISHHLANSCYISLILKLSSLVEFHRPFQSLLKSCGQKKKKISTLPTDIGLKTPPHYLAVLLIFPSLSAHPFSPYLQMDAPSPLAHPLLWRVSELSICILFPPFCNSSQRMLAMLDGSFLQDQYSGSLR